MDNDTQDESSYELVMPLVIVKSAGGELDDEAFVIGWELGEMNVRMHMAEVAQALPLPRYLHTAGLAQLDLIAMAHGFGFTAAPDEDDPSWSFVNFSVMVDDQ